VQQQTALRPRIKLCPQSAPQTPGPQQKRLARFFGRTLASCFQLPGPPVTIAAANSAATRLTRKSSGWLSRILHRTSAPLSGPRTLALMGPMCFPRPCAKNLSALSACSSSGSGNGQGQGSALRSPRQGDAGRQVKEPAGRGEGRGVSS